MDDAGVRSEGREFLARVTLLTDIPLNNQKIDPKIPLSTLTNFNNGQQFNRLTLSNFTARVTKKKKEKFVCPRAVTAIQKITRLHQQRFSDKEK